MARNPYFDDYLAEQKIQLKNQLPSRIESPYPTLPNLQYNLDRSRTRTPLSDDVKADIGTQALTGGLQLASDMNSIAGQSLNLGRPDAQYFAQGIDPSYQGGEYFSRAAMSQAQGTTGGEILSTAGKAAGTGASIGTLLAPGIGTLIAAGIGAVVGGIGAGIGGGIRKRRQRRERTKALELGTAQQQEFNAAQDAFNQQQAGMASYQQRANPYRRLQNLYQ